MKTWLLNATSCESAFTAWAVVIPFLPYCEVPAAVQSAVHSGAGRHDSAEAFGDVQHRPSAKRLHDAGPLPSAVDFDARSSARRL
jgi:hypothetical protein